jgi:D-amino-acid dehydrogenase
MLANCTEEAYRRNKSRMVSLAEYSRDCLRELRQETGITYDHREQDLLQLFRTQKQLDGIGDDTAVLDAYGVPYEILDTAGCVGVEPALGLVQGKVAGGLRLLGDETGDAHLFTQRLAVIAEQLGVRFRYGTSVQRLLTEGNRISGVQVNGGEVLTADAYVAAMGSYTPHLVKPLWIHLPVYPVKGYSLTMPIVNPDAAPVSTVMDETFKVGTTRLGDRIRVGGTAELAGFSQRLRAPRRATLEHSVTDLFPQGGDVRQASFWTGLRPMTPDGTPVVGVTRYKNLYTNTGHGNFQMTEEKFTESLEAGLSSERGSPACRHAE